jgi:uncharacterized protein (TIGR00369 family)
MALRGLRAIEQAQPVDRTFGLAAAGRLLSEVFAPWVQDLGLIVESLEVNRPLGAPADWEPGAVVRMPLSKRVCRDDGLVCAQALMTLADVAMVLACSAGWKAYRPMTSIDQTSHFMRPAKFDVLADARVMRIGSHTSFCHARLHGAVDGRPVGMTSGAYAAL